MKIIQLWDDGIVSDIRLIEILKYYRAKASFCLNPGLHAEDRSFGWKYQNSDIWRLGITELAYVYDGFEICSHSMTHPNFRLPDVGGVFAGNFGNGDGTYFVKMEKMWHNSDRRKN